MKIKTLLTMFAVMCAASVFLLTTVAGIVAAESQNATISPVRLNHTSNDVIDFGFDSGDINFKEAKSERVRCIFHRLTGKGLPDKDYKRREELARDSGIVWGAYHYGTNPQSWVGNTGPDPAAQADRFLATLYQDAVANHCLDHAFLLMLDSEGKPRMKLDQAAIFAERVYTITHSYPGIYVNYGELRNDTLVHPRPLDGKAVTTLSQCWLWISAYRPLTNQPPVIPNIWRTWTMWQYCGDETNERTNKQEFYTGLAGREYLGITPFFYRYAGITHAITREFRHDLADHNLFNEDAISWNHFMEKYKTQPVKWDTKTLQAAAAQHGTPIHTTAQPRNETQPAFALH